MSADWRDAGADVVGPLLGHRSPGHLALATHSAQHGRRRRLREETDIHLIHEDQVGTGTVAGQPAP